MDGMLFERTAIAKRPNAVVEGTLEALRDEDRMSPDLVFRDPYVLDFLGLPSDFSEAELEAAILRELEAFLLELGQGFSVIARPKRMSIGADDDYLDLLFFHRPLRALVAIELKLGRFDARDKEQIELLELPEGSVRVASYLTELPPRELLERKLLESIEHARTRAVAGERLSLPDTDG